MSLVWHSVVYKLWDCFRFALQILGSLAVERNFLLEWRSERFTRGTVCLFQPPVCVLHWLWSLCCALRQSHTGLVVCRNFSLWNYCALISRLLIWEKTVFSARIQYMFPITVWLWSYAEKCCHSLNSFPHYIRWYGVRVDRVCTHHNVNHQLSSESTTISIE